MNRIEMKTDGGTIAAAVEGAGPLVLCIPGMGETQTSFRHLVPELVRAGYRVATMDLRGHGESDVDFDVYDDEAAARDVHALIEELGEKNAVLVGNSMGAAAAVLVAAQKPELVGGVVLIGPFVRDHGSAIMRIALRLMLAKPWGPAVWRSYYASLFGDVVPADQGEHLDRAARLLRRPGRWKAFQKTTRTSHAPAEAALARVSCPALVVMGTADPDFKDPRGEAEWVATAVRGESEMIDGAGHYPMGEQPEATAAVIVPFLKQLSRG